MEDRFALLIDADNVSAKYIKPILDELSKFTETGQSQTVRVGRKNFFKILLRRFSSSVIHRERILQILP